MTATHLRHRSPRLVSKAVSNAPASGKLADMPLRNSTYRFAVGDPHGPQSLVWRLWTNAANNDAYIAARPLGGVLKVSLHERGWRIAFVDPKSPFLAPGQDRAVDKWDRPPPQGGWTRAFA